MAVLRTYRYPLRPNRAEEAVLESWLLSCQQLYNAALEERIGHWHYWKLRLRRETEQAMALPEAERTEKKATPLGYNQQTVELTAMRREDPFWSAIPADVARSALRRLDLAYQGFFRRVKAGQKPGFPRFRARDRYDSIGIGRVSVKGDRVRIPKLGRVRFHLYRPLKGRILYVTLKREARGWFVYFALDLGAAPEKVPVRHHAEVGIDVGLTTFATVSDGTEIPNPRFGRDGAALLARRQQAFDRKHRGSNARKRAKRLVAKAYDLIQNQRKDHARKLAVFFCQKYDMIAHEDLNILGMMHGHLSKSIHDAAWGTFIHCLTCKAEEAGKWVVPVDPRGTSQRCSACGATVGKDLSVRVHDCPTCGLRIGRDLNAALNVLALGRSAVAQGNLGAEGSS